MSPSTICQLAASIAQNTAIVTKHLEENGLPEMSFEIGNPSRSPFKDPRVESARLAVMEATQDLHDLMQTPQEYIMSFLASGSPALGLHAVAHFNMGHTFLIGQTATYEEIASKVGLPKSTTRRLVRQAMTRNFFVEREGGVVAHNLMSAALVENLILADHVCASLGEVWKSAAHVVDNLCMRPFSEESNHTGFNLANNTDKLFFDELDDHPERAKRFARTMTSQGQNPGVHISHMISGYPWTDLKDGLVVDVGGSQGIFCRTAAEVYPRLSFVNQDLEHVISAAAPIPEDYAGRMKMMSHDFFEPQPVKNADLYFLRWILHSWSDKYAIKILRNLIPALKNGARVVIAEIVMPAYGKAPKEVEKKTRDMDLGMLTLFNSKERDMEEWKALFEEADSRFKLNRAICPPGSRLWMMELVWEP